MDHLRGFQHTCLSTHRIQFPVRATRHAPASGHRSDRKCSPYVAMACRTHGGTAPDSRFEIEDSQFFQAAKRLKGIYESESKLGFRPAEVSLSFASERLPFRSFVSQPREQFEASVSQEWLSEWFAGKFSLTYANNPLDGDEFRFDGSYLAVALGNWSFGIDQADRWW